MKSFALLYTFQSTRELPASMTLLGTGEGRCHKTYRAEGESIASKQPIYKRIRPSHSTCSEGIKHGTRELLKVMEMF